MIGKVIQDDGYMITLIRPFKDDRLPLAATVELVPVKSGMDLVKLFDSQMDEPTLKALLLKLDKTREKISGITKTQKTLKNGTKSTH